MTEPAVTGHAGTEGATAPGPEPAGATIDPWLRDLLRCPRCRSPLADRVDDPTGGRPPLHPAAVTGLDCTGELDPSCRLRYPVVDGIPVLLIDEAQPPAPGPVATTAS